MQETYQALMKPVLLLLDSFVLKVMDLLWRAGPGSEEDPAWKEANSIRNRRDLSFCHTYFSVSSPKCLKWDFCDTFIGWAAQASCLRITVSSQQYCFRVSLFSHIM